MNTNANTNAQATQKPEEKWQNIRMAVKSGKRIDFSVDLSPLVDLALPAMSDPAWYGKQAIKSCNIASIPAQKLRVAGLEDVYVDIRVYTKSNAYEARQVRAEQEAAAAEARAKLEAVRPEAEKLAAALGKDVEEVMNMLATAQAK